MQGAAARDWLIPDWPAPAGVHAVCTTRRGGVSQLPYDTLNLGDHVGDDPAAVTHNRAVLARALGDVRPVFLQQVHGRGVERLDARTADGTQADGCVATVAGVACTIMVADCLPVLLATTDGHVVAAAHAGWRGLAGAGNAGKAEKNGVLEAIYESFSAAAQYSRAEAASKTIAWLGPCIGPSEFEVDVEVKAAFEATQSGASAFFRAQGRGKYLADLPGLARQRLKTLGVTKIFGNDGSSPWCTVGHPEKYFSHRRDAGAAGNGFATTGRMAACVWLDA
jgi:YfiH family protein